jgi:hypothetical protein
MPKEKHLVSRRNFLSTLAVGGLAAGTVSSHAAASTPAPTGHSLPVVFSTDLYRPHDDLDDHWDLACLFALAGSQKAELRVLIDYPQLTTEIDHSKTDPDVQAVAQLNYLTGKTVPVTIGLRTAMRSRNDKLLDVTAPEDNGVTSLLAFLKNAQLPVVIHIGGSCLSVAVAANRDPELFAKKCAGIYVLAGLSMPKPGDRLEWNVSLSRLGYAAIFDIPCPVYWIPCLDEILHAKTVEDLKRQGTYSGHYIFQEREVVEHLSPGLRNYFLYMYQTGGLQAADSATAGCDWLRYLLSPSNKSLLATESEDYRSLYATGALFHACGQTVTRDGDIVRINEVRDEAVFTFEPICVQCSDEGITEWRKDDTSRNRFIFRVLDPAQYPTAMSKAVRSLLQTI